MKTPRLDRLESDLFSSDIPVDVRNLLNQNIVETRRAIRLAVNGVRLHWHVTLPDHLEACYDANRCQLSKFMWEDYEHRYGFIDPVTLSILLQIFFAVAGLVLQWWMNRRKATTRDETDAELDTLFVESAAPIE